MINKPKSVTKTHPSQNTEHQTLSEEYKSSAEKIKDTEHKKERRKNAEIWLHDGNGVQIAQRR